MAVDIIADGEGRPLRAALPCGGEGGRPGVAAVEAPLFVGALEPAAAKAAHHDIAANAQQHEVGDPVAVDVDGIGADHLVEFEAALLKLEAHCAPPRSLTLR